MIILLGPDNSGKSTLVRQLELYTRGTAEELVPWKALAATGYKEYIEFLRGPKGKPMDIKSHVPGLALARSGRVIADRFFYCELPYARLLRKEERTKFTLKQWHNMHLSTISFNPVVVLATRKADEYEDHVPEELFDPILREYKHWLGVHGISYVRYDFKTDAEGAAQGLTQLHMLNRERVRWWTEMAQVGYAGVGNTVNPKVVIMAQDLGPMNVHRIPFEQGPSGYYISDLLDEAEVPLSSFYLTNWKKTPDMAKNVELLRRELENTRPEYVILLGRMATEAIPTIEKAGIDHVIQLKHPGWVVNHSYDLKELAYKKQKYSEEWAGIWKTILS